MCLCVSTACTGGEVSGDAGADASTADSAAGDSGSRDASPPAAPYFLGPETRRARLIAPPAHDGVTPLPVVFLLHGYSANATLQDLILGTSAAANSAGYYLVLPEGTVDSAGNQFWNATDVCCDFEASGVDDIGYLTSLLDDAEAMLPIDSSRVYFMGHSNGGYMSYRMACELSERITAIMVLAASDYQDDTTCVPANGVSVLHLHGTLDESVLYDGSARYPSATETATRWARRAGCDPAVITDLEPLDIEVTAAGPETTRQRWETGCAPGLDIELWTMNEVPHLPVFQPRPFGALVADWLLAHGD